jgi:FAD binding domain
VAADRRRLTADILVAGAGPAGLALALQAHDHGAVVRVVDRRPEAIRRGPRQVRRSPAAGYRLPASDASPASTVPAQAGLHWTGRVYPVEVVLADAELDSDLPGDAAQVLAGRSGLVFAFRLGERATWRLLATRPATPGRLEPGSFGPPVSAIDLQALMDRAGLDAAIQDAANLGWKLAFAAARPGDGPLLDSYDRERRPVARQLLGLTNLAFWAEAGPGPVPSALRARLAPLAAPACTCCSTATRTGSRTWRRDGS